MGIMFEGPLDVLKESWEGVEGPQKMNMVSYILKMREQLEKTTALA